MRIPRWTRPLTRLAATHRRWVAAASLCTGVLGLALFKAHGRGPVVAAARDEATAPVTNGAGGTGVTGSAPFQQWLRSPVAPVSRNLFYINLEQFPRARAVAATGAADAPVGQALVGAGEADGLQSENLAVLAKSPAGSSEETEEPENEVSLSASDRFARQARRLHLQSVVTGPTPRAMIDGQMLGEGDVVANFRVLRIEARGITLEREGIKLEVLFKHDLSR